MKVDVGDGTFRRIEELDLEQARWALHVAYQRLARQDTAMKVLRQTIERGLAVCERESQVPEASQPVAA